MDDTAMQTVLSVTNTTPELAQQYLTLADGHAEQAITLFFENGGADLAGNLSESTQAPAQPYRPTHLSSRAGHEDDDGRIAIDDDDDDDVENPSTIDTTNEASNARVNPAQHGGILDDDAAMAARLQHEMYSSGDTGGEYDEDGIRAPIARQAQTLVGPGSYEASPDAIERQMTLIRARTGRGTGIIYDLPPPEAKADFDRPTRNIQSARNTRLNMG